MPGLRRHCFHSTSFQISYVRQAKNQIRIEDESLLIIERIEETIKHSYSCENTRRVEISNKLSAFANSAALIRINPYASKLVKASQFARVLFLRTRYVQEPRNA